MIIPRREDYPEYDFWKESVLEGKSNGDTI